MTVTHYTSADVHSDKNRAAGFARFYLNDGDTAVNVTSDKPHKQIKGPCIADYDIHPSGIRQADYPYAEGSLKALGEALRVVQRHEDREPDDDGEAWEAWATDAIQFAGDVQRHAQAVFDMVNYGYYSMQPDPEKIPPR